MTTLNQADLIVDLLHELGWTPDDIAEEIGEEYRHWRGLPFERASELISYLTERKREKRRERRRGQS